MQHTSGPWQVVEHSGSESGIYCSRGRIAALDIEDGGHQHNEDVMNANARLIAAAPDLLAACKVAMDSVFHWDSYEVDKRTFMMLKAAIAKAEGKE